MSDECLRFDENDAQNSISDNQFNWSGEGADVMMGLGLGGTGSHDGEGRWDQG